MPPKFVYRSLDVTNNEIRLLSIVPAAAKDDALQCVISHVPLNDEISYTALSYAWRDPTVFPKADLDVRATLMVQNGQETVRRQLLSRLLLPSQYQMPSLQIGINLASFLRSAREHPPANTETWYWIDAISINQEDEAEKSALVLRMGQIYTMAETVVVWLGPEAQGSRFAMNYLVSLGERLKAQINLWRDDLGEVWPENEENDLWAEDWRVEKAVRHYLKMLSGDIEARSNFRELVAMMFLFKGSWWQWMDIETISYVISAHRAPILPRLAMVSPHVEKAFLAIGQHTVFSSRRQRRSGTADDFLTTIYLARHARSSKVHDRIYGSLGLASDAKVLVPLPDYKATPSQVFLDLTVFIIKARRDLDVLFLASGGKSQFEGMPTWSVYEDSGWAANPLNPWRAVHQLDLAADRPDPEFKAAGYSMTTLHFSQTSRVITLQGFIIDHIDGLGSWQKTIQGKTQVLPFENPASHDYAYGSDEKTFIALLHILVCGMKSVVPPLALVPKTFGEVMLKKYAEIEKNNRLGQQFQEATNDAPDVVFRGWYYHDREFRFAGRSIKDWIEISISKSHHALQPTNKSSSPRQKR